jgi:hypothetical protein
MCCSVVDQPEDSPMNLLAGLMSGLDIPAEFEAAAASVLRVEQGRSWQGFSLDDVDRLRPAFTLEGDAEKFGKSAAEAVRPSIGSERRRFRRLWPTWSAVAPNG